MKTSKKAMVNASAIKTDTKQYLKEKFNGLSKEEFINIWTYLSVSTMNPIIMCSLLYY